MRKRIHRSKLELLSYGIREVVDLAQVLRELDGKFRFIGENIGDPVAKGWGTPEFVRTILLDLIRTRAPDVFGYTHSRGNIRTRRWVVEYARRFSPNSRLDYEQVVFTSGLGAGINLLYRMLGPKARVLQPSPGYPAHVSNERFAAGAASIGYRLDPARGWQPDLEHMERQIKRHKNVAGILLINPNNPTGAVYSAETLEHVVRLAERYRLMIISDEVYFRMVFKGNRYVQITGLADGRVPLIVMRGLSKDVPWPGARCGWLEFHNVELDREFRLYIESLKKALLIEVCSTSLPQLALPLIYDHPQYPAWLKRYTDVLAENSRAIHTLLGRTPHLTINPIQGAFYMCALFDKGVLNRHQTLPVRKRSARAFIERELARPGMPLDKRFAYYLLAATGICVVPLGDFESSYPGFRITTLERDPGQRDRTYKMISDSIGQYLSSQ